MRTKRLSKKKLAKYQARLEKMLTNLRDDVEQGRATKPCDRYFYVAAIDGLSKGLSYINNLQRQAYKVKR